MLDLILFARSLGQLRSLSWHPIRQLATSMPHGSPLTATLSDEQRTLRDECLTSAFDPELTSWLSIGAAAIVEANLAKNRQPREAELQEEPCLTL